MILAAVLVISAIAKLRAPNSTISSITLLRLPSFLRTDWFAKALPVGEIALAIVMTSPFVLLAQASSIASLVLFASYLAVIVRAMGFSPRPSCGCFGNIGDQRVNGRTVARNILFVALALVFVGFAFTGHTVPEQVMTFGVTGWLWVVMALALAAVAVYISGGTFRSALPEVRPMPPPATPLPADPELLDDHLHDDIDDEYFRRPIPQAMLVDPDGEPRLLAELAQQRAQLLIFGNCYCGSTMTALTETEEWGQQIPAIDVRYIFSGVRPVDVHTRDSSTGWRDHAGLAWRALELQASPSAVLLGADGLLAGGPVSGIEEVREFVSEIAEALAESPADQSLDDTAEPELTSGAPTVIGGELVSEDR